MYYLTHKLELELELAFYLELELHLEAQEQGGETATKRANWSKKLKSGEWQTTRKVLQGLEQLLCLNKSGALRPVGTRKRIIFFEVCSSPGAAFVRWEGKTGRKRPKTRCFARMVGLCM